MAWSRRHKVGAGVASGFALLALIGALTGEPEETTLRAADSTDDRAAAPSGQVEDSAERDLPTPTTFYAAPGIPDGADATVERHIDGDTFVVDGDTRIRLIGVDTPEVSGGVECYGREASAHTAELLPLGTHVRLVSDVEKTDRYGRTLAYVYRMGDGVFVNAALVRDGYAQVATFPPNVAHVEEFVLLQREAREAERGLWSACLPETPPAAPAPPPSPPATVAPPPPPPAPPPTTQSKPAAGGCHSSYEGTCIPPDVSDADCAGGSGNGPWYVQEKDIRVVGPDVFDLDRDGDGFGCES